VARKQSSSILSKRIRGGVPISRRALEQRVDRSLITQGKRLKRTRGEIAVHAVGTYFVTWNNDDSVAPVERLEELGRQLGMLASYERLVED
jgi:hypothetical protein